MDTIKVVCGVIFKEDKVFICRRAAHKSLAGYWEFPGGKVEVGETNENSLTRELQEELGMTVKVLNHFQTVTHDYGTFTITLIAYKCQFIDANFILTDHDSYEWIEPTELKDRNLAPADVPISSALLIN